MHNYKIINNVEEGIESVSHIIKIWNISDEDIKQDMYLRACEIAYPVTYPSFYSKIKVVYRNHNKPNGNCTVDLLEAYDIPVKLLDKIEMDDTIDSLNSILIKIIKRVFNRYAVADRIIYQFGVIDGIPKTPKECSIKFNISEQSITNTTRQYVNRIYDKLKKSERELLSDLLDQLDQY